MEIIHINEKGHTYRLVFTSTSELRCIPRRSVTRRRNSYEKHWPRVTRLNMYINEKIAASEKATRDSRNTDNKDFGMWVCMKKALLYSEISQTIPKEDRRAIWSEFFKSVNIFAL